MRDAYGRKIEYMRIFITDRCNLRCRYWMPDSFGRCQSHGIVGVIAFGIIFLLNWLLGKGMKTGSS